MDPNRAVTDIYAEARRALALYDRQTALSDPEWLSIVTEELGEVARCLNERMLGHGLDPKHLRREVIQVGAMALRFAWVLDERGPKA